MTDLNIRETNWRLKKRGRTESRRDHDARRPRDRKLGRRHQLVPSAVTGIRHRLIAAVGNLRVRFNIVHGEGESQGGFCKGKGEG